MKKRESSFNEKRSHHHMQCWFQDVYNNLGEGQEGEEDEEYVNPDELQLQDGR